jgi:DNA-binding PadR family transcriptional regulator
VAEFQVLLALLDRNRHGHGIKLEVAARTDGAVVMGPGTLYAAIKRMLDRGLIAETDEVPDEHEHDERRRYYRVTSLGRAVARAEAERMRQLLEVADEKRLLAKEPPR